VWHGGEQGEAELLASAYDAAMRLAAEHQVRSIAFPAISTGIYGFPLPPAARIAVETVRNAMEREPVVQEVLFACFSPEVLAEYRRAGVAL
jgi:O-acetyl-ADP-ribose deacetylase (regulator of RNase III)